MNNNEHSTNYLIRGVICAILLLMGISLQAQEDHRTFVFKQGDEYQTEVLTNSNAVVKRGKQILNINSVTAATKSYKVVSATNAGYNFSMQLKKMDNVIESLGQKLHYNSETSFDTTSTILKALDFMMKKPISVIIDKYGIIQSATDYKAEMATDTLASFAGIHPEIFEKQTLFTMLADITYNKLLAKGYTWADSVTFEKQELKTKFTIEEISEGNTIVKFTSSITGKLVNSNTNGTFVINNNTGLIIEKLLYTISIGYQISAGNVVYAVSRSTSTSERTKKVN